MAYGIKFTIDPTAAQAAIKAMRDDLKGLGMESKLTATQLAALEAKTKAGLGATQGAAAIDNLRKATSMSRMELMTLQLQTKNFGGALNTLQGGVKSVTSSLFSMKAAVAGLIASMGLMMIYSKVKEAALLAARYETLGIAMTNVGKNAGYSAGSMDYFAKQLEKTGISMVEARANLTKMTQANLDLRTSTGLARMAQDAAVIANINSSDAFATMIHGIQSGQTEVLKNIGIMVSFEGAYKKAALALGKTSEQLTENEKMTARANAVLSKSSDIAGTYINAMDTAGKQIQSFTRYIENFKVKMGEAFGPMVSSMVKTATETMKELTDQVKSPEMQKSLQEIGDKFGKFAETVIKNMPKILQEMIEFGKVLMGVATVAGNITMAIGSIFKITLEGFNKLPDIIKEVGLVGFILGGTKLKWIIAVTSFLVGAVSKILDSGKVPGGSVIDKENEALRANIALYDSAIKKREEQMKAPPVKSATGTTLWGLSKEDKDILQAEIDKFKVAKTSLEKQLDVKLAPGKKIAATKAWDKQKQEDDAGFLADKEAKAAMITLANKDKANANNSAAEKKAATEANQRLAHEMQVIKEVYDSKVAKSEQWSAQMTREGQFVATTVETEYQTKQAAATEWYNSSVKNIQAEVKDQKDKQDQLDKLYIQYGDIWDKNKSEEVTKIIEYNRAIKQNNAEMYNSIAQYSKEAEDANIAVIEDTFQQKLQFIKKDDEAQYNAWKEQKRRAIEMAKSETNIHMAKEAQMEREIDLAVKKAQTEGDAFSTMSAAWDKFLISMPKKAKIMYDAWMKGFGIIKDGFQSIVSLGLQGKFDKIEGAWKTMWTNMKTNFFDAVADIITQEIVLKIGLNYIIDAAKEALGVASSVTAATALTASAVNLGVAAVALDTAAAALAASAGVQGVGGTLGGVTAAQGAGGAASAYYIPQVAGAYVLYKVGSKQTEAFSNDKAKGDREWYARYNPVVKAYDIYKYSWEHFGLPALSGGRKPKNYTYGVDYDETAGLTADFSGRAEGNTRALVNSQKQLVAYQDFLTGLPSWVDTQKIFGGITKGLEDQFTEVTVKAKGLGGAIKEFDKGLADTLSKNYEEWAAALATYYTGLAQQAGSLITSAMSAGLSAGLDEAGMQISRSSTFMTSLKTGLFNTVSSAMIEAFASSTLVQGAIAPFIDTMNQQMAIYNTKGIFDAAGFLIAMEGPVATLNAQLPAIGTAYDLLLGVIDKFSTSMTGTGTVSTQPQWYNSYPSVKGNVFAKGMVTPFAHGDIFNSPTTFPIMPNRTGLMGEAGPEAIMPLSRDKSGKLGVKSQGGRNIILNVHYHGTVIEEKKAGKVIANLAYAELKKLEAWGH